MKVDPIIAVKDVETTSSWYQSIFGLRSKHGGNEFDILVDKNDEVMLCLHKWDSHEHPTMQSSDISTGNGLILYFRMENIEQIRENLRGIDYKVEDEIRLSPNSLRKEFSLIDPNGYYLTLAEFHKYEG